MSTASQGFSSIGSFLSFSSVLPADEELASYQALTFTDAGQEATNLGEIGNTNEVITYNTVKNGLVNKRIGTADVGQVRFEAAYNSENAAQVILKAANDNQTPIAVVEELGNGDKFYFTAYVSSFVVGVNDTSSVTMLKANLEVTTPMVAEIVVA